MMKIFETERLLIRPFSMNDLEAAYRVLDEDIGWSDPSFSVEQRRERIQFYMALTNWSDAGNLYGYRAVVLKEEDCLIGICGFIPHQFSVEWKEMFWSQFFGDAAPDTSYATLELEIGYALSSHYRGQGYATEAGRVFLDYAFQDLRMKRVFASTDRKNEGSIRLMKRLGMRLAFNQKNPEADWPAVVGVIENPEL